MRKRKRPGIPWSLRWGFAWAALTGNVNSISYHSDGGYRIDIEAARLRRWKERNAKLNAKIAAEKERERNRSAAGPDYAGVEVFDD